MPTFDDYAKALKILDGQIAAATAMHAALEQVYDLTSEWRAEYASGMVVDDITPALTVARGEILEQLTRLNPDNGRPGLGLASE